MNKPNPVAGMRHVALYIKNFEECERYYTEILGMQVEWRPDPDNVYLCSGCDNLALHRAADGFSPSSSQHLDHIGFILKTPEDVDAWYDYMLSFNVTMKAAPRTHRDGARSFYCQDPDGNTIQLIYHPPIAEKC